jgi:catechol 2,3-dioxygenase-like lactoylglutathione lyase family enzyme
MKNITTTITSIVLSLCLACGNEVVGQSDKNTNASQKTTTTPKTENTMKLGAFSVSLSVKDLEVSKQFYEKLGFTVFGGGDAKGYLIMKNENSLIGLFHGMFKGNILTFNPGWDENAKTIKEFDDVRAIQKQLKDKGIKMVSEADENSTGPAGFMIADPDGNVILIDQHVEKSGSRR